jgi:hypothetical protein
MAATADPTAELLRSMTDPKKWRIKKGVVAFRAHRKQFLARRLRDGTELPGQEIVVTDADLPRIARQANESQRGGQLHPLTIGHRNFDPLFPERDQPPLVGFARNYRCETVTRNGSTFKALVYDEYVPADQIAVYRLYPYRSA